MLNKNGWGFRSYIIGSSVLLIALLVATFLIIRLYSNLASIATPTYTYQDIENKLNDSSIDYINEYYKRDITTGVVVVSTKKLLNKEIIIEKDLIDTDNNDKCKGYSLIRKNENDELTSESFIKCDSYQTDGYQSWRLTNE